LVVALPYADSDGACEMRGMRQMCRDTQRCTFAGDMCGAVVAQGGVRAVCIWITCMFGVCLQLYARVPCMNL